MSPRRRLRFSHIFICMTIIIAELISTLLSQKSENINAVIDPIKNVISQKNKHLNTSIVLTSISSTTEVTIVNTKHGVSFSTHSPDIALNVTLLPDCHDFSSKSPEENSSTLIRHFGLQPIKCVSVNHRGNMISVEDLTFVNSTDSSLTVEWEPPKNDSINTCVQWYIIEWFNNAGPIQMCRSSNETRFYTIKNLTPCTKFDVAVTPYVDGKLGSKRMVSAKTRLIVNEDTLKLQIDKRSAHWLNTRWSLPNTECITEYHVTYCNNANCKIINVTTTFYNATDLKPCTEYNFTVAFLDQSDDFGSVSIIGDTEFKKPGAPTEIMTLAGNDTLTILWTPPFDASCVDSYRVTISQDGFSRTGITFNTSLTFSELESCSIYEVTVITVDKNQNDSNTEMIKSNQTLAPIPQPPQIKVDTSTNNTIVVNWSFHINRTNNCSTIEITTECIVIEVLGSGYQGHNGTSSLNITDETGYTTIRDLSPYTNYTCQSIATNSQGKSSPSLAVSILTSDSIPSSPTPNVYDITHTNFTVKWDKPKYLPGELTQFEVMFMWYYPFHRPEWCEKFSTVTEKVENIDGNIFSLVYKKIQPYSKYTVKIKAKTRAGWSVYSDGTDFQTWPGAPGPVSHVEFYTKKNPQNPKILEAFLRWGRPCLINAEDIHFFNITVTGERPDFPRHVFSEIIDGSLKACFNDTCIHKFIEHQLREEYTYKFFIVGEVNNSPHSGEVTTITGIFPAGIPPAPDFNYTKQITIDPYKIRRTTTTAAILLPLFPNTNGNIQCNTVIVSKSGYNQANSSRLNFANGEWPDIASWYESMAVNFEIPYQATKCLSSSYIVDYGKFKAVKFIIGEDTECSDLSNQLARSYCNGPLKPDTWYDVRMRAFTNGGYRDSTKFTIKTNAELQVAVVIGTIFGILFLGILITTMLLIRKCTIQAVLRRFLHSDMPGSPVPTPFNRRKFIAHCQELADNPGKLSNEFQLLQTLSVDLQMPTNAACLQANRKKNRYTDILPYDFSRVKLETIDNDPNSDYINASFIKGCNGDEEYIACQGPKEETTYDFWRMIDQYDIKLIVMLTQLIEKNKEKCHQYYPTIRETFTYENMSIRCSSELDYRTYTQRTLILQKENEKRTIFHLHFKDWPDHDVPEDFDAMINFCQIMRRHISVNRGLAVIHCSAGIGRTGTLIAIDILLQYIKENRKLDVFGTVYRLRHHRINMVQRESQYAYIYNCMRQVLKNPYFSKSYKPPSVDPITDNNSSNKKKTTSMANLVSSLETLKKSRLSSSSSVESVEQIYNSLTSTSFSNSKSDETYHLLHGLRFSKSTSAICSKPHQNQIVRYNTVDLPIFEVDNKIKQKLSFKSLHGNTKSNDSIDSMCENLQQLNRLMLLNIFDDDPTVNQKLLDTSL